VKMKVKIEGMNLDKMASLLTNKPRVGRLITIRVGEGDAFRPTSAKPDTSGAAAKGSRFPRTDPQFTANGCRPCRFIEATLYCIIHLRAIPQHLAWSVARNSKPVAPSELGDTGSALIRRKYNQSSC